MSSEPRSGVLIAGSRGSYLPIGDVRTVEDARRLAEDFEASPEAGCFLKSPAYTIWWRQANGRYRRGDVLVRCAVEEAGS